MSAIYGTNLATDGLEILFDPNNPGSYPGSGDSIFDLSGNSRTGTLYGSPSFSSNNFAFVVYSLCSHTTDISDPPKHNLNEFLISNHSDLVKLW